MLEICIQQLEIVCEEMKECFDKERRACLEMQEIHRSLRSEDSGMAYVRAGLSRIIEKMEHNIQSTLVMVSILEKVCQAYEQCETRVQDQCDASGAPVLKGGGEIGFIWVMPKELAPLANQILGIKGEEMDTK